MRGVLYRTEKDGTTLAVPELRISASNSRTVYYENNAAKQSALNNNEIREGSIVLTGLAGNNEDYATKAYVDSKIIGNLEHQVGAIVGFPGNVPNGYLLCDGNRFDKNKYPELYEYLGTDVLPDYRECVLVGVGQNTTDSIATHDVYTVGQFKDDQVQDVTGSFRVHCRDWNVNKAVDNFSSLFSITHGSENSYPDVRPGSNAVNYDEVTFKVSRVARAGAVTHGKQKGLNWAIKAAPITISSSPIQSGPAVPDYSRAVAIDLSTLHTTGYTVPADGYIVGNFWSNSTTAVNYIYVNNNIVAVATWGGAGHMRGMLQCLVAKNNTITCDAALSTGSSIKFVPFKN
jgi:hypothetical protein